MHIFFLMTKTKTNPKRIVEASTRQVAAQAFRFSLDSAWWISPKPAPTNPRRYSSSYFLQNAVIAPSTRPRAPKSNLNRGTPGQALVLLRSSWEVGSNVRDDGG
jgi:hypothetical protein